MSLHRAAAGLSAVGLLSLSLLIGCETPFRDQADSAAYSLITARQRQALGSNSDSAIGSGEVPLRKAAAMDDPVPPTVNVLPAIEEPQTGSAPAAPAAPASAPATTQSAAVNPSIDALLQNLPGIQLDQMPELPPFPKPAPAGKTRRALSLDDAFNYALAHSRDYLTRKEDLYLTALNVTLQRHQYDPQPFATSTIGMAGSGEASDLSAALNATQSLGVNQRLPGGATIVATALASTVQRVRRSVSTANSSSVSIAANLPLLRGAGPVADENLIAAERTLIYEVRDFERFRRGFLVSVATQYFSLINQRAQVVNRFRSVRSYIFITERSKALFEAGMARRRTTLLDVMRAAQSEFQARSSLINAIEQYELALDRFKLLLGMPIEQPIDVTPQYLTIAPPALSEIAAIQIADQLRLDLQTVRDQVDDARRATRNSVNNLLPDLNLTASAGVGSDPSAHSLAPDPRNLNYATNLTLAWPLDRLAERNNYRSALVSLDRAKRNVDAAEDQVASDVRAAIRAVRQQQLVLAIQKNNIDLAQKRKTFSDIQFRDGKIDNRDYLDAETALLDAQNSFAQALSDLEVSVLRYLRDTDQLRVDFDGRLQLPAGGTATGVTETAPATLPASQPAGTRPAESRP